MTTDLAILVDPGKVTAALAAAGLRSTEAEPLRLDRAWPANGNGLVALYRTRPSAEIEESWSLIGQTDERPPSALRRLVRHGQATWLSELRAFALAFPRDPRLPNLESMLNPEHAARSLPRILGDPHCAEDLEPHVLRYKPLRRCVIEYRFRSRKNPAASLFCKAQRRSNDVATREIYLAMQKRVPSSGRLHIAHPVGSVNDWNMLIWSRAPGQPLGELLDHAMSDSALDLVARALADFHCSQAELPREHKRSDELRTLSDWVRIAASAHPDSASALRDAYAALMQAANRLPLSELVPSHRDFHQGQLLLEEDRVVFLDLDTAALSEAELDVGNFMAHLVSDTRNGSSGQNNGSATCFRGAYERESNRRLHPGRLAWYQSSSFLRLACVHSFRPAWSDRTSMFVDRACDLLDEIAVNSMVTR